MLAYIKDIEIFERHLNPSKHSFQSPIPTPGDMVKCFGRFTSKTHGCFLKERVFNGDRGRGGRYIHNKNITVAAAENLLSNIFILITQSLQ